jgi:hypothetical protein
MNTRKRFLLGLVSSLLLTPTCWAQLPGGVPGAPPPPALPAVPASPPNLWSYLLPNAQQKANCKTCYCNSPIGQMTSAASAPMAALSGGLMTNRCAQNALANDLLKPADSSEGAAAKIKKDEADAKARREAVRYLGTVDCHYWPEATEALAKSLRLDPNECVRFEAALSLRNGCCCNEKTVKALEYCVSSSDKDGAPAERSDRVRAAAADALARCPLIQKEIDFKNGEEIKKVQAVQPREAVVVNARGLLVGLQQANAAPAAVASAIPPIHVRSGSLSGIYANAIGSTSSVLEAPVTAKAQPKSVSLYEVMTARNAKQEIIVPVNAPTPQYGPREVRPAGQMGSIQYGPREIRPVGQMGIPVRLPVGGSTTEQPRETVGYITIETEPVPAAR